MDNTPLVSVVVLTYNSEKFIETTLDSVLSQNYERIELIISDDGSKDSTCPIVEKWLFEHANRFEHSCLIKSFKNAGTCKNYNQGVFNSHGEYIKTLDGDDILNGCDALKDFTFFLKDNNFDICISDVKVFSEENYDLTYFEKLYAKYFSYVRQNLLEQKKQIVKDLFLPDPGLFFSRKLYNLVGGFDENYKLQEEWPFFMKVLDANVHIEALNKKLVCYRITSSSATHGKTKKAM